MELRNLKSDYIFETRCHCCFEDSGRGRGGCFVGLEGRHRRKLGFNIGDTEEN
jgi:hypothetical protein